MFCNRSTKEPPERRVKKKFCFSSLDGKLWSFSSILKSSFFSRAKGKWKSYFESFSFIGEWKIFCTNCKRKKICWIFYEKGAVIQPSSAVVYILKLRKFSLRKIKVKRKLQSLQLMDGKIFSTCDSHHRYIVIYFISWISCTSTKTFLVDVLTRNLKQY